MIPYLAVIVPSLGVGVIFYYAMKAIFNADKSEREALTRAEQEAADKGEFHS